mgnify:CR=1 FL=1
MPLHVRAALRADIQQLAGALHGVRQLKRLAEITGHRLLNVDMLAGIQGGQTDPGMPVVDGRAEDDINVLPLHHLPVVLVSLGIAGALVLDGLDVLLDAVLGDVADGGDGDQVTLVAIENENQTLRGKLDKRFGAAQLEPGRLGELVDLISTIGFADDQRSGDVLGEVYEYFLGQFASAEGKKGGQFYTPAHVVKTLVAVLAPHKGRIYDPCCGSGGMFVQSEKFIQAHGGKRDDASIYGQESNPTTWRLAAMNLAIRGFAADLGQEPADTFARDQFPDQKFDYILANPPFNISDWGGEKYESDPRWVYGRPPVGNANYAWLQHMLWKLRPGGEAGVVLANGSMSSNQSGEGQIREAMVRGDVVEVMVALPGQLF